MNRTAAALLILAILTGAVSAAQWLVIEPAPNSKTGLPVTIGGKLLRYSPATNSQPLSISVEGPTVVRAKVRVPATTAVREFKIIATLNGSAPAEFTEAAMPSNDMEGPNGMKMSMEKDVDFKIPEGKHTLTLQPAKTDTSTLYFRAFKRVLDQGEPSQWESIAPRGFRDLVGVVVREKETTYYRQTSTNTLQLKFVGPTRVRILSRAEVPGGDMDRIIKWRLEVKSDGQSLGVFPCEEQVSSIAGHSTQSEFVMTAAAVVNVNLPQGKHDFTISLLDPDLNVVNRILIPAKSLQNGVPNANKTAKISGK